MILGRIPVNLDPPVTNMMYLYPLILILVIISAPPATAQSDQPKQAKKLSHPDNLIPLPEPPELPKELADPPPLPPDIQPDPELETQVTIIKRGEDTIEEHRINGELMMIKVIPRIGPPYYLKKNISRGHTHAGDAGIDVSPPMWQFLKF
ncbi:uncharacterized protein DUF2782 [Nitrosomonas oligotropha]|jgi:hypothetical protein|uniref:Uncharacterized protein DUF2782 n=1 Tax=Nitrosomonas oligotropha TaxID=42354 RepID=A0A2T5HZC9_9PROT|nr:DUF2782 domain-containing protein [Nitrosomonas oligotropha]PTQ76922.1 uncharacterized protein DUF2782 [Nitrosomonas oligotropha]